MEILSIALVGVCLGATWGLLWMIEKLQETRK